MCTNNLESEIMKIPCRPSLPYSWRTQVTRACKMWSYLIHDSCDRGVEFDADKFISFIKHCQYDILTILQLTEEVDKKLRLGVVDFDAFGPYRSVSWYEFRVYHQILVYLKKLRISRSDLHEELTESFMTHDRNLPTSFNDDVIFKLREVIHSWLNGISFENPPFDHGGGSVAEKGVKSIQDKDRRMVVNQKQRIMLRLYNLKDVPAPDGDTIPSRLTFVPKSYKTERSICMEPISNQFFQQGFMKVLYRWIQHHPYLKHHIVLKDQTKNHRLAQLGSLGGGYATVDLAKASDSVSWKLVQLLFKGTALYPALVATRSRYCVTSKGVFELQKFAPMGSALCFPIECLIFAAVVEVAMGLVGDKRELPKHWQVYGDDIVCPSEVYTVLVTILEHLGFEVNTDKSYVNGWYRESCGKEYYRGYDVTPIFYKSLPNSFGPKDLSRWISHANQAYINYLPTLRKACLNEVFEKSKEPIKLLKNRIKKYDRTLRVRISPCMFGFGDGEVFTDVPENVTSRFYHRDYQCAAHLILRTSSSGKRLYEADHPLRLYTWLCHAEFRYGVDELDLDKSTYRQGNRWTIGVSFLHR